MSAERTVATSSAEPRQGQQDPATAVVVAPRDARGPRVGPGSRQPYRQGSAALLPVADISAAALGALVYAADAAPRSVLGVALLVGVLLAAAVVVFNAHGGLYRPARLPGVLDELPSLWGRVAVAWCVTLTCVTVVPGFSGVTGFFGGSGGSGSGGSGSGGSGFAEPLVPGVPVAPVVPGALLAACAVHCAVSACGRALLYWRRRAALVRGPRPVLVLGSGAQARRVAAALLRHPRCGMRPVGVVCAAESGARQDQDTAPGLPVLSTADALHRAAIQNDVRTVLIAEGPADGRERWLPALHALGCDLWELSPGAAGAAGTAGTAGAGTAAAAGAGVPRASGAGVPRASGTAVHAGPRPQHVAGFLCRPLAPGARGATSVRKRALDVAVSAVLLLLAAPVLLGCAALLRALEGPGIVFRQERVGMDGRRFTLLKFRTHRPADSQEAATRWSVADEDRMSAYCRFLRRTSLDELPQLWNVLRGDMSLVGPRPERPFFVAQFSQKYPEYERRHRMPTGITGLAQIHGLRGDTSIEDRCRFDNAYIDSWSFWQDLCILLRTVGCLVRHSGS
ncbi:sugar transferase [Streptomyces sp. NPDC059063]|uniref:sugar transferase n=1 Tax=unclassified Streptomyces TaxID=2593676 RepID=UPI00367741A8